MHFITTKEKHSILRITALVFLLQLIAPAFQAVMAKNVVGYTDTVCTMNGQKTAFVVLKDNQEQSSPKCYECPACIIQANLNGLPEATPLLLDARYILDSREYIEPIYQALSPRLYPHFLSRAPPA